MSPAARTGNDAPSAFGRKCRGLTLVELMVAMTLGLIVMLGVVSIMSSNQQNYRITESISELQENARAGFELIARDARAARDTGCGSTPVNTLVLFPSPSQWWQTWQPVLGFDGTTAAGAVVTGAGNGQRVAGTHALQLQGTRDGWPLRNTTPGAATVTSLAGNPFAANHLVVICDLSNLSAQLHRVTGEGSGSVSITPVTNVNEGQIAHYRAVTWYIGNNGRVAEGGRALYRVRYEVASAPIVEEVLSGVTDMTLRFRTVDNDQFLDIDEITNWDTVNAIELTLTAETTQARVVTAAGAEAQTGSDGRMRRSITHIIAIRNTEQ